MFVDSGAIGITLTPSITVGGCHLWLSGSYILTSILLSPVTQNILSFVVAMAVPGGYIVSPANGSEVAWAQSVRALHISHCTTPPGFPRSYGKV